ncbi:SusD/RagB family nutrient-binding outer membrane lipoprotein [Dysgonomonas sp. 511]|uniref:SusD/RagB family nutrient-binding outer membrane lipoprotein n=1 Tax=Dysgonomonas sp. 511 TaxID=2302930 RepID=UPI0013D810E2|nr:SusD/RagB family nutrient-binding outer membrane lipoprotein [Dysgonomonas sp. 511]NDV79315.1 SusD/RagB family nutrient-binding outer membrane lipoprotein [Dysgonomonas sp. 511]
MRKFINNIITKVLFVVILTTSACTSNFMDHNSLPDQPEPSQIPDRVAYGMSLKNLQSVIIHGVKNRYQRTENLLGGVYGRYFAHSSASWTETYANFNAPAGWYNNPFNFIMTDVYTEWFKVQSKSGGEGVNYAWAQVLRIAAMHRLTDIVGPIPYSQMGKSQELTTAYDSQQDVYMNMFADLDVAIKELTAYATLSPEDRSYAPYDLVYQGDISKWVKFANSLKLRMAMRISYVDPTNAEKFATEAITHAFGVMTSVDDTAEIDYSGTGDMNTLWWMAYSYNEAVGAADIITYMKSYGDPRLEVYFNKPASGEDYAGLRVGAYFKEAWRSSYSLPAVKQTDKMMWLSAAEVAFLRAEMALKGWAAGGTAQQFYEQGITLSFLQNKLSEAQAATYYKNSTLVPAAHTDARKDASLNYSPPTPYNLTLAWKESAGIEEKLEKIITQKWIALYPLGTEAWCEQRRTGYPRFYSFVNYKGSESGLETIGASRTLYPATEKDGNAENYQKALQLLGGGDLYGTKLWWDVKTNKPTW